MIGGVLNLLLHPLSTVWSIVQLVGLVLIIWALFDIIRKDPHKMGKAQKWIWAGVLIASWLFSLGLVGGLVALFYLFVYRKVIERT